MVQPVANNLKHPPLLGHQVDGTTTQEIIQHVVQDKVQKAKFIHLLVFIARVYTSAKSIDINGLKLYIDYNIDRLSGVSDIAKFILDLFNTNGAEVAYYSTQHLPPLVGEIIGRLDYDSDTGRAGLIFTTLQYPPVETIRKAFIGGDLANLHNCDALVLVGKELVLELFELSFNLIKDYSYSGYGLFYNFSYGNLMLATTPGDAPKILRNITFEKISFNSILSVECSVLDWCSFAYCDMQDSQFSGAILTNCSLAYADCRYTNFCGARCDHVDILGAKFTGCQFDGVEHFIIKFPEQRNRSTHQYLSDVFDHTNNNPYHFNGVSIFRSIESIPNKYRQLKTTLMKQVIDFIYDRGYLSYHFEIIYQPLMDIVSKNTIYRTDQKIKDFIALIELKKKIHDADKAPQQFSKAELEQIVDHLFDKSPQWFEQYVFGNNNVFNQILFQALYSSESTPEIIAKAEIIQLNYFKIERIHQVLVKVKDIFMCDIDNLEEFSELFVMVNAQHVLVIDADYMKYNLYQQLRSHDAKVRWSNCVYLQFINDECIMCTIGELSDLLSLFEIFISNYIKDLYRTKAFYILKILSLDRITYQVAPNQIQYLDAIFGNAFKS